jgi:hypothetical protein
MLTAESVLQASPKSYSRKAAVNMVIYPNVAGSPVKAVRLLVNP